MKKKTMREKVLECLQLNRNWLTVAELCNSLEVGSIDYKMLRRMCSELELKAMPNAGPLGGTAYKLYDLKSTPTRVAPKSLRQKVREILGNRKHAKAIAQICEEVDTPYTEVHIILKKMMDVHEVDRIAGVGKCGGYGYYSLDKK